MLSAFSTGRTVNYWLNIFYKNAQRICWSFCILLGKWGLFFQTLSPDVTVFKVKCSNQSKSIFTFDATVTLNIPRSPGFSCLSTNKVLSSSCHMILVRWNKLCSENDVFIYCRKLHKHTQKKEIRLVLWGVKPET